MHPVGAEPRPYKLPRKKVISIRISTAPSIDGSHSTATSCKLDTPVSGGAYQDARKVSLVWNAKLKHCFPPEFRGRMHQTRPSVLFSPIFSRAREKIGPPEARQKRPRRNEPPQATSLILCARFFLSKPQTEFAVWVFLCKSAMTSQSRLRRASSPARGALRGAHLKPFPFEACCRRYLVLDETHISGIININFTGKE